MFNFLPTPFEKELIFTLLGLYVKIVPLTLIVQNFSISSILIEERLKFSFFWLFAGFKFSLIISINSFESFSLQKGK